MININKSQPAPACLDEEKTKKSGTYDCGDVRIRLVQDFFNKCYICEELAPSSLDIEHFKAHNGDIDLKYAWINLFLACSHCNNAKLNLFDDILNCTDFSRIITECIKFEINPFPKERTTITPLQSDPMVLKTVELLDKVYNGNTIKKVIEADNIRSRLIDEVSKFSQLLLEYYQPGLNQADKDELKTKIRRMLSVETAFTAFKIWVIKRNPDLIHEFGNLLPVF